MKKQKQETRSGTPDQFFRVDHGLDNYEELISLKDIVFVRSGWSPAKGCQDSGTWKAKILLRNGREEDVYLSEKGYEDLIRCLKAD